MFRKNWYVLSVIVLAVIFIFLASSVSCNKLEVSAYAEDHVYFVFGTYNTTGIFSEGEKNNKSVDQVDGQVRTESPAEKNNYAYFSFGPANATSGLDGRDAEDIELGNNLSMDQAAMQSQDPNKKEESRTDKNEFLQEDSKAQRTEVNDNETIVLIIISLLMILLPLIGWLHDKRKGIRYNRVRGGRQLYLKMRKAR